MRRAQMIVENVTLDARKPGLRGRRGAIGRTSAPPSLLRAPRRGRKSGCRCGSSGYPTPTPTESGRSPRLRTWRRSVARVPLSRNQAHAS